MIRFFVLLLLSCCFFSFSGYAAATPSELEDRYVEEVQNVLDDLDYDDLSDEDKLSLFEIYLSSLSGPGVSTASEAQLANIADAVNAIRAQVAPVDQTDEDPDVEILDSLADVSPVALGSDFSLDRNVLIFEGTWAGISARLVVPYDQERYLFVDDDGILYNVGTSNVTGRIFYDDFNPLDYEIDYFTLTPCLGNNANTLFSYNSTSYNRHYYLGDYNRLSYTDSYGNFYVSNVVHTPSDSPYYMQQIYLLVLIGIGGVIVLCCFRRSWR